MPSHKPPSSGTSGLRGSVTCPRGKPAPRALRPHTGRPAAARASPSDTRPLHPGLGEPRTRTSRNTCPPDSHRLSGFASGRKPLPPVFTSVCSDEGLLIWTVTTRPGEGTVSQGGRCAWAALNPASRSTPQFHSARLGPASVRVHTCARACERRAGTRGSCRSLPERRLKLWGLGPRGLGLPPRDRERRHPVGWALRRGPVTPRPSPSVATHRRPESEGA